MSYCDDRPGREQVTTAREWRWSSSQQEYLHDLGGDTSFGSHPTSRISLYGCLLEMFGRILTRGNAFSGFAQKLREDRATSSRQRWSMVWMPDIIRILCSSYDPRYYDIIVKYHPDPSSHDNYCWTFRRGDNSASEHAHPIDGPHFRDWHGTTFHWTLSQRL